MSAVFASGFAERRLVQPLFYRTQGIAPFERGLGRRQGFSHVVLESGRACLAIVYYSARTARTWIVALRSGQMEVPLSKKLGIKVGNRTYWAG
jgi:hypothetical protein